MEVFVIVTHYMNGIGESGVFASMGDANAHIAKQQMGGDPMVVKCNVVGELDDKSTVFTASTYDHSNDIHNFKGVFGNFEQAKIAAGEKGLVLNRTVQLPSNHG
ncbi:MAG TPA: hypothetical protein VFP33_10575 [Gallionella sp.]|nr:hypothetical protein [Gallionella sp.]